jgi:anti-anti-sigma factor
MSVQLSNVRFEREGAIAIAVVSGEIDMSNATSVRQRIAEFVTPDDQALVLDLSSVSFMDSAGLHAVFELGEALDERRQQFRLVVSPTGQVSRTLEIIGIPRAIWIHPRRDVAVEAATAASVESRPVAPHGEA